MEEEPSAIYDEPETFKQEEIAEPEEVETEVEETAPVEEQIETPEAPSGCLHYLGYLSEKPPKEQISDECIMCKDNVTCMLKKMKE